MDRSPTEWAVLGLIAEGPGHGFSVARELAPDGSIGRIWTVTRPLAYRALRTLERDGLVAMVGVEPGGGGPPRQVFRITGDGRSELDGWLSQPVGHVRDLRTSLLMKLALLDRVGADPGPLLRAQARLLERQAGALDVRLAAATGFDRTLMRWRAQHAATAKRFVEDLLTDLAGLADATAIG